MTYSPYASILDIDVQIHGHLAVHRQLASMSAVAAQISFSTQAVFVSFKNKCKVIMNEDARLFLASGACTGSYNQHLCYHDHCELIEPNTMRLPF